MVWSREALPTYLYGIYPDADSTPEGEKIRGVKVNYLNCEGEIPAGLFRDPTFSHVSAIIFSNAATLSKFNRMGFLAGWRPPGLKLQREGHFFDRTPGARNSIPFSHDILSEEYARIRPWGEAWCQELEVYHNPLATNPLSFGLLPGATHWFDRNGEVKCSTIWEWSVLSSITLITLQR